VAQDDKHAAEPKAKLASSATLLVNPDQAEAISLAGERGAVRLVLRGPNDHKLRKPKPVPAAPKPAPVAARPAPVVAPVPRPVAPPPVAVGPKPAPKPQPVAAPPAVEIIRGFSPEGSR